jgi:hypothetical protein
VAAIVTTSIAALTFAVAVGTWPNLSDTAWRWMVVPSAVTFVGAVVCLMLGKDRAAGSLFIAMAVTTPTGFSVGLNVILLIAAFALIAITRGVSRSERGAAGFLP